jgi:Cu(I)/Ag(I) efflux system membrane protein CusA/SilA
MCRCMSNAEIEELAKQYLQAKVDSGQFQIPPGVHYTFAGSYENQIRAQKTLAVVIPPALFIIFLILYLEFRTVSTMLLVFSGIIVAWSGGFLLIWFYNQPWFLNFAVFGVNLRELFQVHPINLSVAIWVGFLALFGIASDDGVVMGTCLVQSFRERRMTNKREVRAVVIAAGTRRVRPCRMTAATIILALIPVLSSTG